MTSFEIIIEYIRDEEEEKMNINNLEKIMNDMDKLNKELKKKLKELKELKKNIFHKHILEPLKIDNNNILRFQGFKDVYGENSWGGNDDFKREKTYPKNTDIKTLYHYLNEGYFILERPKCYNIVKITSTKIFLDYYRTRLINQKCHNTKYDNRYITYIKE